MPNKKLIDLVRATGLPLSFCRMGLEHCDGNYEEARNFLKEKYGNACIIG